MVNCIQPCTLTEFKRILSRISSRNVINGRVPEDQRLLYIYIDWSAQSTNARGVTPSRFVQPGTRMCRLVGEVECLDICRCHSEGQETDISSQVYEVTA